MEIYGNRISEAELFRFFYLPLNPWGCVLSCESYSMVYVLILKFRRGNFAK